MSKAKENIRMKFICDQDWDAMNPTDNGRFCSLCKQEVYDFTNKSISEVNALKKLKGDLCGNFRADQIEQDLRPINFGFPKRLKYSLTVLATFFGVEFTKLSAQAGVEKNPYVKVDSPKSDTSSYRTENSTIEEEVNEAIEIPKHKSNKPFMTIGDSKFYWSKKFPFIKRRKMVFRGKF